MASEDETEATTRAERIETLLQQVSDTPDPQLRAQMEELLHSLLDLFGDGLARMLALAEQSTAHDELLTAFASDELVGSLLLLYGLHPEDTVTRVKRAVEGIRGAFAASGGQLDLLSVTDGVARVRLAGAGGCRGCAPSGQAFQTLIELAIYAAAPEIEGVSIIEAASSPPLISLTPRRAKPDATRAVPRGGATP